MALRIAKLILVYLLAFPASPTHVFAQSPGARSAARELERFSVFTDGDLLLVPVTFNARQYLFAVDTGASVTMFDSSLVTMLGPPIREERATAGNKEVVIPVYGNPGAHVGKLVARLGTPIVCTDLSGIRKFSGHAVYGCLGMDFLKDYVMRLDSDNGELRFSFASESTARRLPLYWFKSCPAVDVTLNGLDAPRLFVLDTAHLGARTIDLSHSDFESLSKAGMLGTTVETASQTVAGRQVVRSGHLGWLELAGVRHKDVQADESLLNTLGLELCLHYNVTLDFPGSAAYFEVCRQNRSYSSTDKSGLIISRSGGMTLVEHVSVGSPAQRAGIHQGDLLIGIDSRDASALRLRTIRRLLSEEGKMVQLAIKRESLQASYKLLLGNW
jgi:hypothetical protein